MKLLTAVAIFSLAPALFAQDFDFKTLDKLGASATSSTNVTLDGDTLRLAAGFLGNDGDKNAAAIKSVVDNLKGIYVRSYKFDKPGQYAEADLAPLRAFLKQPQWKVVVDVHEEGESTQVYFLPAPDNKLGGVAIVSAEPAELTVVYVNGVLNMSDLMKLSGNMGVPDIRLIAGDKSSEGKSDKKTTK